jgi:signal transduction histidine kinase
MEMKNVKNRKDKSSPPPPQSQDQTMIYALAHDIKSPLSHVEGLLLIAKKMNKDPELEGILQMAINANRNLTEKVNDMLDASLRERNKVPVDLKEMIRQIWDSILPVKEENILMVHRCEINDMVLADKIRLKSILQNLMENAIKYRKKEGKHKITIRSYLAGNQIHIKVMDNGLGIRADDLQKIFQASYRANSTQSGHGMGLYLALRNARHMGGTLIAESEPAEGTTFTLTFPITP